MERKNIDQPDVLRVEGVADKVAPRRQGRQWYLDPDLQLRYEGDPKVRTKALRPLVLDGQAKADFVRPRRPKAIDGLPELDLEPLVPRVVRGVPQLPSQLDPRVFEGDDGVVQGQGDIGVGEGYVRMRVRVSDGTLSILDSHLVDGPLREGAAFHGGFAYDVVLGDELLHAGPLPDFGERRSYVDPNAPAEEQSHHVTTVEDGIFTVRVPAHLVTQDALRQIEVRLFRLKDDVGEDRVVPEPLDRRFRADVRVIARTKGLPKKVLPEEILRRGDIPGRGPAPDQ